MSKVEFRDLTGMVEFRAAEALQTIVWGDGDTVDPADLMMVIQQEGGLVAGAFQAGRLLGYVFGFPTVTPGVQHSHRLAVHPDARGKGLGGGLKWYQRDWCLAHGITHVRWTYDPLLTTNASLNIARLGGRVRRYLSDYYGAMEGINKGAPSDRLLVDWQLDAPHVIARVPGSTVSAPTVEAALRIAIPTDFAAMLAENQSAAVAARLDIGGRLIQAFQDGYAICGYDAVTREYLLSRV